jgi:hypothetical protein
MVTLVFAQGACVLDFLFGLLAVPLLALLAGYPLAILLGARGLVAIGMASSLGVGCLLVLCRGAQVLLPMDTAASYIVLLLAAWIVFGWSKRSVRRHAWRLYGTAPSTLGWVLLWAMVASVALNLPIIFGPAFQFEGTGNHDSFTFVVNAKYMLGHVFDGLADVSPERPVFSIARGYFGAGAMQPRPGSEGVLALLSRLAGADPFRLYNGVATGSVVALGLASFALFPRDVAAPPAMSIGIVFMSPGVIYIALNSNFAAGFALVAATGYVGLVLRAPHPARTVSAVILLAAMLASYPEVLPFVLAVRCAGEGLRHLQSLRFHAAARAIGLVVVELLVACAAFPWLARAALATWRTAAAMSHAGVTDQSGALWAGVPMFALVAFGLLLTWRAHRPAARALFLALTGIYLVGLAVMAWRGYGYGGFKLAQYFAPWFAATLALCMACARARSCTVVPRSRASLAFVGLVVLHMAIKDTRMVRKSLTHAGTKSVTPGLLAVTAEIRRMSAEGSGPVAIGPLAAPFHTSMWLVYFSEAPLLLGADPASGGYLRPYMTANSAGAAGTTTHEVSQSAAGAFVLRRL